MIEADETTAVIAGLRSLFFERYLGGCIRRRLDRCEFLEVLTDYETDHFGEFTFVIGHRVSEFVEVPEGMIALEIPRRRYAIFTVDPDPNNENAIAETEQAIARCFEESTAFRRAYSTDLIISDGLKCRYYVSIKR